MEYTTIEMLAAAQDGRDLEGGRPLVRAGASLRRYGAREGAANPVEVEVLSAGSLGRHGLLATEFERLVLDVSDRLRGRVDELRVREGDVVMSLSPPFPAIYVRPEFEGVLVPSGMVLIRADEGTREVVDPRYLAGWLSSETVRERVLPRKLNATRAGLRQRARRTLSEVDLLDVSVPLPPMEEQRRLGELVVNSARSEVQHRAQQRAETRVVELYYWRTCVEASCEGEVAMDGVEGMRFADETEGGNVADAIRDARSSYVADGGEAVAPFGLDGGGRPDPMGSDFDIPDFPRQPLGRTGIPDDPQGAATESRGLGIGASPTGCDYREMERTITPEWYEGYVRKSEEASRQFLESFRAIAGADGTSNAPPGEAPTGPGEPPPETFGPDDELGGPPGDSWGDPYDVRIF